MSPEENQHKLKGCPPSFFFFPLLYFKDPRHFLIPKIFKKHQLIALPAQLSDSQQYD